jgi:hypothetical protein
MRVISTLACLTVVVAALAATGGAVPVRAATKAASFEVTMPATVTDIGGNCCFLTASFAGTGVVPMLGKVTFTGVFVYLGTPGQTQPCEVIFGEVPCEQALFIQIAAASGRQMTIRSDGFWEPPASAPTSWPWAASGDVLGSGTYSTTLIGGTVTGDIGQPLTITLSGTMTPDTPHQPNSDDAVAASATEAAGPSTTEADSRTVLRTGSTPN